MRLTTDVSPVSQCFLEEAAPHALVELARFRRRDDQRTQRTGGRHKHGPIAVEGLDRGLEAERAESVADAIERGLRSRRRPQPGLTRELTAELGADLGEARGRNGVEHEPQQLDVAAARELERLGLGRDLIPLRGPARAGTALAPGEDRLQVPDRHETLEAPAGNRARELERRGEIGRGGRIPAAANEGERVAEGGITDGF